MIPRACKRLAEVDFPIAAVSKHAAREKSIRHGHPSTLHLWWARRPLASSRAVLLALALPDPCDPCCPEAFKRQATEIMAAVRQPPADDAELRRALLWFIGAFANWNMSAHATYLQWGAIWSAPPTATRRPWWWTPLPAAARFPSRRCASGARRSRATSTRWRA